ncbi:MAG: DUF1820 family protein [Spirochaetaceae bacterium]|nr:DUF1820 family protein [Spirochaetaceae bacterium]
MSIYRVHFTWKEKQVLLKARSLDLTHPYFVSIKDLVFTKTSRLVIDPSEDEILKEFGGSDHLMIPFQSVILIEEIMDKNPEAGAMKLFVNNELLPGQT